MLTLGLIGLVVNALLLWLASWAAGRLSLPFHITVDPYPNPVPLTVSVKAGPPGAAASGLKGWLTKGIAFVATPAFTVIALELPLIELASVAVMD